ncbi:MAG: hypothetical protein AMXMBFR7_47580 [Planctomycetota bacterium]
MQDNGPLIALIFLILLTAVFGLFAHQAYNELMGDDPEGLQGESTKLEAEIKRQREDHLVVEDEIRKVQIEIEQKKVEIQTQLNRRDRFTRLAEDYDSALKGRQAIVNSGRLSRGAATELGVKVAEKKDETRASIRRDENDTRERADAQVREMETARENAVNRAVEERKKHEQGQKTFRMQKNLEQTEVDEYKRQLDALTQREVERATVMTEIDGKVILSDPVNNTIVVSLGTVHGVQNGFRFECFTIRPGNQKVHKAFLEVRKALPSVSECMVVEKKVELPRDPLSDYVAPEPEYKFSPYHESGRTGSPLLPLSARPKEAMLGMNKLDPVVEGDFIQNPFYAPGKKFTYYISGSKAIVQGVQKGAIHYTWPHIQRTIEFYGGKVVENVDLGVNYIIAQKNAKDDDADQFSRAVTLGLPVIYEWELFRFLDQR